MADTDAAIASLKADIKAEIAGLKADFADRDSRLAWRLFAAVAAAVAIIIAAVGTGIAFVGLMP